VSEPEPVPVDPARVPVAPADPPPPRTLPVFESRKDLFLYLWIRIRTTRRYWLIPVLLLVVLGGLLLNLFTGHNVLPAIYSLIP